MDFPKKCLDSYAGAGRNRLDLFDWPDNLESHNPILDENQLFGKTSPTIRAQPRPGSDGFFGARDSPADGCSAVFGCLLALPARKSSIDSPMSFAI